MNAPNEPVKPQSETLESNKHALAIELRDLLGVGAQMAHALAHSRDPGWQEDMIRKYGGGLSGRERDGLWRRIRPYDPDAESWREGLNADDDDGP